MAFGIKRSELLAWKDNVANGEVAFLTHYWIDERFPGCNTVTKVGCSDLGKLAAWGRAYGLREEWVHQDETYPHFDLFGERQLEILEKENQWEQIERFKL
ncbi:hypothetical protein [Oceanobacillus profundus]|uniref:YneQ n=1 Tax=Oceanobacillus profundus TaxID=372463 RepID=A0A417Y9U4_9BACI|nr:hypothetical protein [Oceanobacillus profundus]MBR3121475.1 hypothetical protein [Oceanobacillus sp.]PAE29925.1 hypothetical protein CHI07_06735 [Paenibacillus sp. 7884-2]MCM3396527.1 hypothetical protein [Oceanobacillus profundus]MDO6451130.1 hypothetical protein [Oceanobacillus profundus]RHW29462.1 hypothetical protein D1B32_22020 [Oceanobacillus profundus]